MENKVISKEYVDKNYVAKDKIREAIEEGMLEAKGFGEEGGAYIIKKYILVAMGDLDAETLDSFRI